MFRKLLILFFLWLTSETALAASNPEKLPSKKIIFLDFYNQVQGQEYAWLERNIGELLHTSIKNTYRYKKVSRAEWQNYSQANRFQNQDFFNADKIQSMGRALGADGIIFGKFYVTGNSNSKLKLEGRILSVIDGEIIGAKVDSAPLDNEIFGMTQRVSNHLATSIKDLFVPSDTGAVWRASLLPGWGQYYKQRKVAAFIWGGVFLSAFTVSSIQTISYLNDLDAYNSAVDDYQNAGPNANFDNLFQTAQSKKTTYQDSEQLALTMWYTTMGIYLLNIIDAYIFDGDYTYTYSENINLASTLRPAGYANQKEMYLGMHSEVHF